VTAVPAVLQAHEQRFKLQGTRKKCCIFLRNTSNANIKKRQKGRGKKGEEKRGRRGRRGRKEIQLLKIH